MLQAKVEAAAAEPPIHAGTEMLDPAHVNLHRLEARGSWMPEKTVLLDNKVRDGVVGYEVVTPLRLIEGNLFLLVNRGWIRAPQLRSELPTVTTPAGIVVVEGVARIPSSRFIELGKEVVSGPVWQNLTMERYAAWSKLPLQPVMLYQAGGEADGLLRVEAAPEATGLSADRHRGYALTWFSLAGVTIVLGAMTWYRYGRKQND
jgi:surfeit locus 1 family protein